MAELKIPDYTQDSGLQSNFTVKTSPVNDFQFVDSIEFDQAYEDVASRKVLAAPSNTGQDIFGKIETSRRGEEGFYKIIIPNGTNSLGFEALVIESFLGGVGGGGTYYKFGLIEQLPGAAPGGNMQMGIYGYPYMPDLPDFDPGAGYLWYDTTDGNTVKYGT